MRYALIEDSLKDPELAGIAVTRKCAVLDVSVSSFYDCRNSVREERPAADPGAPSKISDEIIIASVKPEHQGGRQAPSAPPPIPRVHRLPSS